MASTRLPAVRTQGSCPMINEARHKATGATRRAPACVNGNKAMSSISPPNHFHFRHRGCPHPTLPHSTPPQLPHFGKPPEADMESKLEGFLLSGLESESEISSLEKRSGLVTYTKPPLFLHLILTATGATRISPLTCHFALLHLTLKRTLVTLTFANQPWHVCCFHNNANTI